MSNICLYNDREWLNDENSPYTGSIVCYDGIIDDNDHNKRISFIEIGDCHNKIRLHQDSRSQTVSFLDKIKQLYKAIGKFIKYFENERIIEKAVSTITGETKKLIYSSKNNIYFSPDGKFVYSADNWQNDIETEPIAIPCEQWIKDAAKEISEKYNIPDSTLELMCIAGIIAKHKRINFKQLIIAKFLSNLKNNY